MDFFISKNTPTVPHRRHWQFCVGSGHAKLAHRTDYTRILKMIHDELGIRQVRFHGIFNDDMWTRSDLSWMVPSPISDQFNEQSFQQIGLAYDNVLSAGMKPFVELGFMPKALASGDQQLQFYYGGNVTPPADYDAWERYIRDFFRFLFHRYGQDEVRTWYFEVWNEPDLGFFSGDQADYFELYAHTARAIKSVDAALRVGGPATSGSKWVKDFVRYCRENDVPVDFVTTHQYCGDPLAGVEDEGGPDGESAKKSEPTPEEMQKAMEEYGRQVIARMEQIENRTFLNGWRAVMLDKTETEDVPGDSLRHNAPIVKRQAEGLPLFYTEWNMNAIYGSYTNDTRKVAAFDVKAALETEDTIDGSSIWCFSDIFEEFHYFPEEFNGGFGLVTHSGIPKPVFYGLKMLAQAGDLRYDLGPEATTGEIGIAAFQGADERQILLFRQKMKQLDLPKETTQVTIELEKEPEELVFQRIDEDHCNPLKLWEEMGSPQDLNRAEVEDIIRRSAMVEEPLEYTWESGKLIFTVSLGVNDLYFIRMAN